MKHKSFQDFLYDKNDILLALAIIVVAGLLIYWRMNVIMNYPQTLAEQTDTTKTTTEEPVKDKTSSSSTDKTKTDKTESTESNDTSSVYTSGKLTNNVKVSVAGGSATAAVQSLIDAGLFTSYEEFDGTCKAIGVNAEDIKAATFTFVEGSTQEDIAKKVTK